MFLDSSHFTRRSSLCHHATPYLTSVVSTASAAEQAWVCPAGWLVCPHSQFTGRVILHILFVCTGNICRSPTAERLAAAYAADLNIADFRASSAGTRAVRDHPIHHNAAQVIQELGGETSNFSARQLTPRIASDADIVLTMTTAHRDAVLELAPHRLHRTFTLIEAARIASECDPQTVYDLAAFRAHVPSHESSDVPDPIGQDPEFFASVGAQIATLLPPILNLCR